MDIVALTVSRALPRARSLVEHVGDRDGAPCPVVDRRKSRMVPTRAALSVAAAALATVGVSACGGSSTADDTVARAPAPTSTATPTCPTPAHVKPADWSSKVPADLPKPPNAHIDDETTAQDGVHIVKFSTPSSLRDSVLFVVEKLPKAGYVLGRGDAEASEADAPFIHGDTRGLIRMLQVGLCQTQWLLATVDTSQQTGNSPLLTPHTPTGSPSPLPFG
jgi:hypothetical protein